MRGVAELRRVGRSFAGIALVGLLLAGCETFRGRPDRIYTVAEEVANAREALPGIATSYEFARSDNDRIFYRNEYIARRMYIIDAEFTEFETALTKERGEFGFTTAVVTQGLTTAGAVFTPANTVRTLSALAGGVNASRGFYDSELLVNKTIQIVQAQMEAKRDIVASRIISKVNFAPRTYPLSAALHDLEDYYRAGTLTAGLIKASAEAGEAAKEAATQKEAAMVLQGGAFQPSEDTTKRVLAYFAPGPKRADRLARMSECLFAVGFRSPSGGAPSALSFSIGANNRGARLNMMKCASENKDPM
ncbi:hypothetical protein QA649_39710 [Bradyrhizobium sp. CB1717]|uniref:hypothetical protein n=1 Tax=Bradyrhizobium TaxID=374 RepID=UPI0021AAB756|nr:MULTISPECIES: hypothetical protein [unclassified Bradyrhizobium]UWU78385.1 hypothetical protein N2603_07990 [Bradyrhizobium sp. CB3035]WFU24061.1 hypothetical protein QA649_39710 [Bradyrhizobium sp. CB1717]